MSRPDGTGSEKRLPQETHTDKALAAAVPFAVIRGLQMEKKMSETVTGYIDHVIFRNEDNGYTVMVLKGMEEERELTCVGTFPAITQGAAIEASGNYTTHPVYGKQFQIAST